MQSVSAYVNHGRWVADCPNPECRSAVEVKYFGRSALHRTFGCIECGHGVPVALWDTIVDLPVSTRVRDHFADVMAAGTVRLALPAAAEAIEAVLRHRRDPARRNWLPDETTETLRRENRAHGLED